MNQTNVKTGSIALVAAADQTDKEYLLAIKDADGKAALAGASDTPQFVILDGAEAGEMSTLGPLSPDQQTRVTLSGTCSIGDELIPAASGMVATRSTNTTSPTVLIAEEDGVDGQHVLGRPPVATPAPGVPVQNISGSAEVTSGESAVAVTFATELAAAPSVVLASVRYPVDGAALAVCVGAITTEGFTATLSAATAAADYFVDWLVIP